MFWLLGKEKSHPNVTRLCIRMKVFSAQEHPFIQERILFLQVQTLLLIATPLPLIVIFCMRDAGFEPAQLAWEANVLTARPIPPTGLFQQSAYLDFECVRVQTQKSEMINVHAATLRIGYFYHPRLLTIVLISGTKACLEF